MRYTSIDELEHFEFHDAELQSLALEESDMVWVAKNVNVTTANSQNDHPTDMCIKNASLLFESAKIESIVFCEYTIHDANGVLIEHVKPLKASPDEFNAILRESLDSYCFIRDRYTKDELASDRRKYTTTFTIDGGAGVYDLTFSYDRVIVSWDELDGKAWYEDEKWKRHDT